MILTDDDIKERIESPLNLLNRLKKITSGGKEHIHSPSLPSFPAVIKHPALPPSADQLIENLDDKIAEASARSKAMNIMNLAMDNLQARIPEIQKPKELSDIANSMSKIISNQSQNSASRGATSQIIVYAPQVQKLENFDIIDVTE